MPRSRRWMASSRMPGRSQTSPSITHRRYHLLPIVRCYWSMAISDSDYLVTTARDLGAAMKHFRTGAGVTQADAAEAMGIGQPYLSSLEGESSVARGPEFRIRLEWCPEGIERWGLGRGHSGPGAPGGRLPGHRCASRAEVRGTRRPSGSAEADVPSLAAFPARSQPGVGLLSSARPR